MKILITRSINQTVEIFRQIKEIGHEPISVPLLEISTTAHISNDSTKGYDGLIITSVNSLPALLNINRDIRIYVVGNTTIKELKAFDFNNLIYIGHNILELKEKLKFIQGKYLYLSARDVTDDLHEFPNIDRKIVYEANFTENNLENLISFIKLDEHKGCVLFSKRSAERFLYLIHKYELMSYMKNISLFCFSNKIADLFKKYRFTVYISETPELKNIVDLIQLHSEK